MFIAPYENLDERQPWENRFYNDLITALQNAFTNLNGIDMTAPLVLSKSNQHLDGGGHNIYGIKKWFGYGGSDVCLRDVTGAGAKGDGTTDDLLAIQAVIDELPTWGGIVFFPPGTYVVSGSILMAGSSGNKTNVTLMGSGRSTTLKFKNTSTACSMIRMGNSISKPTGMAIMGFSLDGNKANQAAGNWALLDISDTAEASVWGVRVFNSKKDGIVAGGSSDAELSVVTSDTNDNCGIINGTENRAFDNLSLDSCFFYGNTIDGGQLGPFTRLTINGSHFHTNGTHGLRIQTQRDGSVKDLSIGGASAFRQNGGDGLFVWVSIDGTSASGLTITGNTVGENGANGIRIKGEKGKASAFIISGNAVNKNGNAGISATYQCRDGSILGNELADNCTQPTPGGTGLVVSGSGEFWSEDISILGNIVARTLGSSNQDTGIYLGTKSRNCGAVANVSYGSITAQGTDAGTGNDVSHNQGF